MPYHASLATRLESVVAAAIEQRIFPGAVVLIAHEGEVRHLGAYGHTMYDDPGSQPVRPMLRYDIASLTKMFTATVALQLLDEGVLELDTLAAHYLPGLAATGVTVRHLLTHTSGLSLRLSLLRDQPPEAIRAAIYAVEPHVAPGTHVAYVNINSLLLGDIIAHVCEKPLDAVVSERLLEPLAMQETGFNLAPSLHPHIAPTEWDESWRGGLVQGTVHDESAWALGGVAGHAGLFSTAADLQRFLQMWLEFGAGGDMLKPATIRQATQIQTDGLKLPTEGLAFHCGFGWMVRHPIIMAHAPPDAYGHTGFTGPTLVNVPSRRLSLVLLSNRVYPRRAVPAVHHETTAALLEVALETC